MRAAADIRDASVSCKGHLAEECSVRPSIVPPGTRSDDNREMVRSGCVVHIARSFGQQLGCLDDVSVPVGNWEFCTEIVASVCTPEVLDERRAIGLIGEHTALHLGTVIPDTVDVVVGKVTSEVKQELGQISPGPGHCR